MGDDTEPHKDSCTGENPALSRRSILRVGGPMQRLRTRDRADVRPSRRSVLTGLTTLAAGGLGVSSVVGQERSKEEIPRPTIEGPIEGGSRTGGPKEAEPRDVTTWGYVQEEYFVSGEAMALGPAGLQADTEDEVGTVSEYATRMIVYRPENRGDFSGRVVINWPNQTLQEDNPVTLMNTLEYLAREGHVGILFSAQKQGVDGSPLGVTFWDPVRYGDLSHPGDEYGYDMLSQITKALKRQPRPDPDPLGGRHAGLVYASGVSQSAGQLLNYINLVQELHGVVDGFLPFNTGSTPQHREDIRDDLVPVLWLTSEDETGVERRPDGGLFKLWEVAGASHVNAYTSYWRSVVRDRDQGSVGGEGLEAEWDEAEAGQYGEMGSGVCAAEGNFFPYRYALVAGVHHLDGWVSANREPPTAPRIERDADGTVRTDEHGNVLGGLRLPPIDVPVAEYQARRCEEYDTLFGQTIQFRTATLQELYPTHDDYLADLEDAVDDAMAEGFLLPWAADDLMERARRSDVPQGELP